MNMRLKYLEKKRGWKNVRQLVLICPDCRLIERRIHRRIAIVDVEKSGFSFITKVESEACEPNGLGEFYEI